MRLIKMFALAAIAVGAFMAYVGATSAMAVTELEKVVLCKTAGATVCPGTETFAGGTTVHAELKSGNIAKLLSGVGTVECTTSTTLGATTAGSTLAHGEISALAFGGPCKLGANNCVVTPEHLNYLVKGELNAAHNGYIALVTEKGTNGRPAAQVACENSITCSFGAANVEFAANQAGTDAVWSILQTLEPVGFFCGLAGNSVWHAEYLVSCLSSTGTTESCFLRME